MKRLKMADKEKISLAKLVCFVILKEMYFPHSGGSFESGTPVSFYSI